MSIISNKDVGAEVIQEFDRLSGGRHIWESHWQEIAERMLPDHSGAFTSSGGYQNPGEKRNSQIVDSTAAVALQRFAAIMDSLLTPRSQKWHRLMASNSDLMKQRDVKLWFEDTNNKLFKFRYAPRANFASQNQQNFTSLGAYGTGCLFTDELQAPGEKGLRYRNIHLGEVYFDENHQGIVDTAYRAISLTARQARQKWGDALPEKILVASNEQPNKIFKFVHCVKPRHDYDPERLDAKGLRFASYYVSTEDRKVLQEGGYNTFPYAISRYRQNPNEIYGRSPAMDVLPAVKMLNEQKKTLLKQAHRAVDPVLLTADDGIIDSFSLKPGAINAGGVTADGRPLVHALPTGNVSVGLEIMQQEQALINDAFLITLFQIMTETPQMTATEVLERTREKGILLAPTIGRQQSEYLGPLIDRELDLLSSMGVLLPMPEALKEAEGEYRLEYDSPMSRAQRAEEGAGGQRTLELAMQIANVTQDPSVFDHLDLDKILIETAAIHGMPESWLRDPKEVEAMRQSRSQQAAQQQEVQAAPAAAALMKAQAMASKGK
jgi:hypothetical protein